MTRIFVVPSWNTTSASDQGRRLSSRKPSRYLPRACPGGSCHRIVCGAGDHRIRRTDDQQKEPRGRGFFAFVGFSRSLLPPSTSCRNIFTPFSLRSRHTFRSAEVLCSAEKEQWTERMGGRGSPWTENVGRGQQCSTGVSHAIGGSNGNGPVTFLRSFVKKAPSRAFTLRKGGRRSLVTVGSPPSH